MKRFGSTQAETGASGGFSVEITLSPAMRKQPLPAAKTAAQTQNNCRSLPLFCAYTQVKGMIVTLRQRIISAMVGLAVLAVALLLLNTIFLNIIVAAIAVMGVYEVLMATKYTGNRWLTAICLAFAAVVPFTGTSVVANLLPVLCYIFFAALFGLLLAEHERLRLEQMGVAFMMALLISISLGTAVHLRDSWGPGIGLFYILLALGSAWWSDSGAFFAGSLLGRHKLAPNISPKKTMEGFIGGIFAAILGNLLVAWLLATLCAYPWMAGYAGGVLRINYLYVAAVSPVLAVAGVFGDLSASVIKRQCQIKDFGSIMPGHGGVLDRFDSVLFVLPLVTILAGFLPIVTMA